MRKQEEQQGDLAEFAAWIPLTCTLVVLVGLFAAATLALPSPPQYPTGPLSARDLFHPEWLIAAALLALPIYLVARRSWRVGLVVVLIAGLQVLYIADTAIGTLHHAGIRDGFSSLWYVVALVQLAVFVSAGAVGAVRDLKDRHWARMMGRILALPPPPRSVGQRR